MRVAYHAHYLVWFELGRTELLRQLGCPYGELEQRQGIFFPVRELGARYRTPAHYDDLLLVRTRLTAIGRARVRFEYEVVRQDDGAVLATGFTEHAAVGPSGRPLRLPGDLRRRLEARETG